MLVEKYKPKKMVEIVGHATAITDITNFIKDFKPGKALLMHGSTGIGKSILSAAIANDNNLSMVQMHSSEVDEIKKISSSSTMMSIFGKKRIIVVDEIDNFSDKGAVTEIINMIKTSKFPVILTADDAYDKRLRALREYCTLLSLRRLTGYSVIKKLKDICTKENINAPDEVLLLIANNAHGDLRAALNDLQILAAGRTKITETDVVGFREREMNIFDSLRIIFKSSNLRESIKAIDYCDKDLEEMFWWIEQNITNEFNDPKQVAAAFEVLSRADMFRSKIDIGNFRMMKYMKDVMASMALIRKAKDPSFIMYRPPQRLVVLGRTKVERAEEGEMLQKLAQELHCSKRSVKNQMPYLNIITSN